MNYQKISSEEFKLHHTKFINGPSSAWNNIFFPQRLLFIQNRLKCQRNNHCKSQLVIFPNIVIPHLSDTTRKWFINWKIHHDSESGPGRAFPHLLRKISLFFLLCSPVVFRTQPIKCCSNLNYLLLCLFELLHTKLFENQEHASFIFVYTVFSIGLAHRRNVVNLCHVKEGRRWEGRTQTFF